MNWKEANKLHVRWMCTQWCNFKCPYCPQQHQRRQVYKGSPGHWADNAPVGEWCAAFERRFSGWSAVTFHLTGGEPLLDVKNTAPLLRWFAAQSWVERVEIDTNGSFDPSKYEPCPKFELQVSYHPTETSLEWFVSSVRSILSAGWRVMSLAMVVRPEAFFELDVLAAAGRELGVALHALLKDDDPSYYTEGQLGAVMAFVHPHDRRYVNGVTAGKPCLYPAVAYEVDPDGSLIVPCHRSRPWAHGSLFGGGPLPKQWEGFGPCPKRSCCCDERYPFLQEIGVPHTQSSKGTFVERARSMVSLEVLS